MSEASMEVIAKGCAYAVVLLAVGAAVAQRLLSRTSGGDLAGSRAVRDAGRRLDALLVVSAVTWFGALVMRAAGHSVTAFGWTDGLAWEQIRLVAIESQWGEGWQIQMAAAVALNAAAIAAQRSAHATARRVCLGAAVAACLSLPRTGHAAASESAWLLHSLHVLAAGCWAGTLLAILCLAGSEVRALRAPMLRAFAPVAMAAVAVLSISGAIAAISYVGTTANLFGTEYGRLLTVKLALVGLMLVLGARNFRSLRHSTNTEVPRTAAGEAVVAVVVTVLTTWLTETAHP